MAVGCPLTNVVVFEFVAVAGAVVDDGVGAGGGLIYCGGPFLSFGCVVITAGEDL